MRTVALLALLAGCPKQTATEQAVNAAIACPAGTQPAGKAPPEGFEAWCQRVAPTGEVTREGPAITWHPDGTRASAGSYAVNRKSGFWSTYYPDGKPQAEGSYEVGVQVGLWKEYHPSGELKTEGEYAAGKPHGYWTYWHPNGQLLTAGDLVEGDKTGTWIEYDEQGKPKTERVYRNGRVLSQREL